MKGNNWDIISQAGKGAALAETSQKAKAEAETMRKLITIPKDFDTAFSEAKAAGKVGGKFASYITEAVRLKLKQDGII